jgi:hypothetical protein
MVTKRPEIARLVGVCFRETAVEWSQRLLVGPGLSDWIGLGRLSSVKWTKQQAKVVIGLADEASDRGKQVTSK